MATKAQQPKIMLEDEKAFGFIKHNSRPPKPRKTGVTEIRGPYYAAMGKRYLEDILETCVPNLHRFFSPFFPFS